MTVTSNCFTIFNRNVLPCAGVPLTDRGFRFGMHLFETIAVQDGRWLFYHEHLDQLFSSAKEAGFSAAQEDLFALGSLPENAPFSEGVVRIYWTAGDGLPGDPPAPGRIFLFQEPGDLPPLPGKVLLKTALHPVFNPGNGWKTGNYWLRCGMLREAREQGFGEAIVCDSGDQVIGACMANAFFLMDDGRIVTPPAGGANRPGVIRGWVLDQISATECRIARSALKNVRAILITNSRIGIASGISLDGWELEPFPGLERLASLYLGQAGSKK